MPAKVLVLDSGWSGGTLRFFIEAFREAGCQVETYALPGQQFFKQRFIPEQLMNIEFTKKRLYEWYRTTVNQELEKAISRFKPDILFVQNESDLLPWLLEFAGSKKIVRVNINGDFVFDSTRYKLFPVLLSHFDIVFYGEKLWLDSYQKIAPKTTFVKTVGAYAPAYFYPVPSEQRLLRKDLTADVAFAGSSYGFKAEGQYRGIMLAQIAELGLKYWGGDDWSKYFTYYPQLKPCYQGRAVSFQELNILYQNSLINLNIPNPQCFTSFQQRLFEIAAAGAFQLADYREEIFDFFSEDEVETFRSIDELKDKIVFYRANPSSVAPFKAKALRRMEKREHTYAARVEHYLKIIKEHYGNF